MTNRGWSISGSVSVQAPDDLHPFIRQELHHHLRQLLGHTPRWQEAKPALSLGLDPALGTETHAAELRAGVVHLQGGDAIGLYHAVLAFLEAVGCRWLAPGDAWTIVPRVEQLDLPAAWQSCGTPALRWRGLHICGTGRDAEGREIFHYDHETALWMARNRFNFKPIHIDEYEEAAPLLAAMLLTPLSFGHSYSAWIPATEFESHPEWFPLVDGHRLREGQRCLSNPELSDEWAQRIAEYARTHPDLPIISLAPNDGYRWCTCEACQAMDAPADQRQQELNRRNHLFSAKLASRLREVYPSHYLSTLSYCNYLEPADDLPAEPNLAISLCAMHARNHPLDATDSPLNQTYLQRLQRWLDKAGQVVWSSYDLSYGGTLPQPYDDATARTLSVLAGSGAAGLKTEVVPGRHDRWRAQAWPLYLLGRLCANPDADSRALRQDFCQHAYGAAAEVAHAIYALHEEALPTLAGEDVHHLEPRHLPQLYPPTRLQQLRELVDTADANSPAVRERLQPLLDQAREVIAGCAASQAAEAEAKPLLAPRLPEVSFDCWDDLAWVPQRQRSNQLPFQPPNACAVAWTEDTLWLCFQLGEPDVKMARAGIQDDQEAFAGSNVDCFLAPPAAGVYFQLCVNLAGHAYSARCQGRQWDSGYDLDPEILLRLAPRRWDLLIGLRWAALQTPRPVPGDSWRLALNRGQQCDSPRTLGGWPHGGSWHNPATMGVLHFDS